MTKIYNFLCFIIIAVFSNVNANDYYNLNLYEEKRSHTTCIYRPSKPAPACGQTYSNGLNDADRKAIVDKHNKLRRKVASGQEKRGNPGPQPAAVRMPDLSWDNELETIAQKWANQCNFNHDECRNVDRFAVGQNIAEDSSPNTVFLEENTSTILSMIQGWYDEVANFNKDGVFSFKGKRHTGHYTQLVWADTTKIGCGLINYKNSTNNWNTKYFVCNYGPSGNRLGQKIYEVKKPDQEMKNVK